MDGRWKELKVGGWDEPPFERIPPLTWWQWAVLLVMLICVFGFGMLGLGFLIYSMGTFL